MLEPQRGGGQGAAEGKGEEGEWETKRRIDGDLRELERAWIGLSISRPGASKQVQLEPWMI